MKEQKGYERAEHTADIALKVYGKTLDELFENASYGMLSFILKISKVAKKEEFAFRAKGETQEELLVNFLSRLNYLIEAEKKVFKEIEVKIKGQSLTCKLFGEDLDFKRHKVFRFIKAVTYHNLKIKKDSMGNYRTEIVFDV